MSNIKYIEINNYHISIYDIDYIKRIKGIYGFIYVTTNLVNGKKYVGQRKIKSSGSWEKYLGSGNAIKKAIKIYGKENFDRKIIDIAFNKKELNYLEYIYSKRFNVVDDRDWYNLCYGGNFEIPENAIKRMKEIYNEHGAWANKPVAQYDLSGNFIKSYNSAIEAAKENNISHSNLCSVCRGEVKSVGGYQWRYCDLNNITLKIEPYIDSRFNPNGRKYIPHMSKEDAIENFKHLNAKIINQYSLDDIYINTYESMTQAKRETGINNRRIAECCDYKRNDFGGFKWFYANDPNQPDKTKIINKQEIQEEKVS